MHKMEDSGVEWIGKIPEHWKISYLKYFVRIKSGDSLTKLSLHESAQIPVIGGGKIIGYTTKFNCDEKNILIGRVGANCGCVTFLNGKSWATDNALIVSTNSSKSFLYYLLVAANLNHFNISNAQPLITSTTIKNLKVVLPSDIEQNSIVDFLDSKCSEIRYIRQDIETEIETLKEYKKSVITNAVTKGLDPDVEMKDSGVKHIGKIPKDWKCAKTLYCLSMPITDGPHITPVLQKTGIPFVSAEAVSFGNGKIDFSHIRGFISKKFYNECCKKYIPKINDIYMIKSGATTGKVAIVDTNKIFTIWSPLAAFRADEKSMIPKFLFYSLQSESYLNQVSDNWNYGTQQNIGMRTLEKLKLTIPSIRIQQQITDYLDTKCVEIDSIIETKEKQLSTLDEYKKSLIYEYVTGKKEVPSA